MDTKTIIIFVVVWVGVTGLIIVGCKVFAQYCYKPRFARRVATQDQANQSLPVEVITAVSGSRQTPLSRLRSQSMPVLDLNGQAVRHQYPPVRRDHYSPNPPNYRHVLSHPSKYRKKSAASQQGTLGPPPPHYDDLSPRPSSQYDGVSDSENPETIDNRLRAISSPTIIFISTETTGM